MNKNLIILLVTAGIIGSILYLESQKPDLAPLASIEGIGEIVEVDTMTKEQKAALYPSAKEITTPDGFINTEPFTVKSLIGKKIILIDFWTYSCINCQRTLPFLQSWHEKYKDEGLVVIGVHTPEFEFEKDYANVVRAVEKWGVEYPVVLDNDFSTWRAYKNRYWPRKYLIDIDGFIVYDHIGEGGYDETEKKIVELLNERKEVLGGDKLVLDMVSPDNIDTVNFSKVRTPEIYFGSLRIESIVNLTEEKCLAGSCDYVLPEDVKRDTYALGGTWTTDPESADLESDTGSILIRFSASKVNLVVANKEVPTRAEIYLDGELVNGGAGADVVGGIVTFDEDDLYNLIDLQGDYGEHLLEIRVLEKGLSAFAFTFG